VNPKEVMDQVAARLDTIQGLRAFPYAPDRLEPPAVIVAYPETIQFDKTYGRGMDQMTLPVVVVVGRATDRAARDQLVRYCGGAGAESIKAVVESGTYTAFDVVRVDSAEFSAFKMAGTEYVAATFSLDIVGQGGA
jgi:hypothetical protein